MSHVPNIETMSHILTGSCFQKSKHSRTDAFQKLLAVKKAKNLLDLGLYLMSIKPCARRPLHPTPLGKTVSHHKVINYANVGKYDGKFDKEKGMQLQKRLENYLSIAYCVPLNQPEGKAVMLQAKGRNRKKKIIYYQNFRLPLGIGNMSHSSPTQT